ncbi:MAG: hypothetical protein QXP59_03885 [Saccharolobus sp.]
MKIYNLLLEKEAKEVLDSLLTLDDKVYIVGGYVRDLLSKGYADDVDILISQKIYDAIINGKLKDFEIKKVGTKNTKIIYILEYKKFYIFDISILETDLKTDMLNRDFTMNALAINYKTKDLIDYVNGVEDIKNKTIRAIGNPEDVFKYDPIRMLRALRFAAKLEFKIEENTFAAIVKLKDLLKTVSPTRIHMELLKGTENNYVEYFKLLEKTGIIYLLFPEFEGMKKLMHDARGQHYNESLYQHIIDVLMKIE